MDSHASRQGTRRPITGKVMGSVAQESGGVGRGRERKDIVPVREKANGRRRIPGDAEDARVAFRVPAEGGEDNASGVCPLLGIVPRAADVRRTAGGAAIHIVIVLGGVCCVRGGRGTTVRVTDDSRFRHIQSSDKIAVRCISTVAFAS